MSGCSWHQGCLGESLQIADGLGSPPANLRTDDAISSGSQGLTLQTWELFYGEM